MQLTIVSNYPRTPDKPAKPLLRNALARMDRGGITPTELSAVEDEVTREVMAEQEQAGVDLLTDGQVRWFDEITYVAGKLSGVSLTGLIRFFDTNTYYRQPVVEGPLGRNGPILLNDYRFAKGVSTRPVKAVLPGPLTLALHCRDSHYGSLEDLALAFAEVLNAEARDLTAESPPLIQFNEPAVTVNDVDAGLNARVWKRLLDGISGETGVYFYFGLPGRHLGTAVEAGFATVGIDATIDGALALLKAGPLPRNLGLGAVNSRTTRLERQSDVEALLREALALMPSENIYAGPNMGLEFLPREQAKAKLNVLRAAIDRVTGDKR